MAEKTISCEEMRQRLLDKLQNNNVKMTEEEIMSKLVNCKDDCTECHGTGMIGGDTESVWGCTRFSYRYAQATGHPGIPESSRHPVLYDLIKRMK
jgi:hypothetical protein